jgi:hypothetical protein
LKTVNVVGAVIIVAILMFGGLAALFGNVNPADWHTTPATSTTNTSTATSTSGLQDYGTFSVSTDGYNTLNFADSYSANSTYNVDWVAMRGGSPQLIGTNSQNIELIPQDYGVVYAVVQPVGAYYVDAVNTVAKNAPYCVGSQYSDIENNGYNQWSFKMDLSQTPAPQGVGTYRQLNFYPYFYAYAPMSLNSPSDITGIGTASVTSFIDWQGSFSSVNTAFAITKVELVANTTDPSQLTITSLNLPGVGEVTGSMFGQPFRGEDSLTWDYVVANGLNGADYVMWSSNSQNKVDLTTQVQTVLSSGEIIDLTLNIYGVDYTGTPTSIITDTVALQEVTY